MALVLIASGVAVVCAGCGQYSKQDIAKDARGLIPPGAQIVSFQVVEPEGFNRTLLASVYLRVPGKTTKERVADYLNAACAHGWTVNKQDHIENHNAYVIINTDILLKPGGDEIMLVMKGPSA